jgi:hypothetical protein
MTGYCCKAGRVAADYGFADRLADDIGAQWEAADGPGLRRLAERLNVRVVKAALLDAGESFLDGEAELIYELLAGDEVAAAERSRVQRRLSAQNIDPEALSSDFVSHRTIDRHFKQCSDRSREEAEESVSPVRVRDRIGALRSRLEQVTAKSIADIHGDEEDLSVMVQVTVLCSGCNRRQSAQEFIDHGCDCRGSTGDGTVEIRSSVEQ